MRVKFYREHKYVSFALSELERLIAKTDFRETSQVDKVAQEWNQASSMLSFHAQYESEKLHSLLESKGSKVHEQAHDDHEHHAEVFNELQNLLEKIKTAHIEEEKIELGYQFYLTFRKFVGENLLHLHEEETKILPELQRLYTDEELKEVENATYRVMTTEHLVHMLQVLFLHMNKSDKETFISDIRMADPEKFELVWQQANEFLPSDEVAYFTSHFI